MCLTFGWRAHGEHRAQFRGKLRNFWRKYFSNQSRFSRGERPCRIFFNLSTVIPLKIREVLSASSKHQKATPNRHGLGVEQAIENQENETAKKCL